MTPLQRLKFYANVEMQLRPPRKPPHICEWAILEIERLREIEAAALAVLKTFRATEATGATTRDRRYAIEVLGHAEPRDNPDSPTDQQEN